MMADIDFALLDQLIEDLRNSESRLFDAAQHAQNRGLKLVLKSYAQQHKRFADQLAQFTSRATPSHGLTGAGHVAGRGWDNLWAGITVQRRQRQRIAIAHALEQEENLLANSMKLKHQALPPEVKTLLREQISTIQAIRDNLERMAAPASDQALIVRLFDETASADRAVANLENAGIGPQAIYQTPVNQVDVFQNEQVEQNRSRWATLVASMIFGGVLGALLSTVFIIAQRTYLPNLQGFLTRSPLGVSIEILVIGILTGALFALIAGLFISESAVEDDAYFYQESLDEGKALVAVYASPTERSKVERILGIQQQFEVEPQPA